MKTMKLMTFDLGSNLGWSYCTCMVQERSIIVNDFGTINLDTRVNSSNMLHAGSFITRQQAKLLVFENIVDKLTSKLMFDAFVSEDVFFSRGRVASYRSLILYLNSLERIVNQNRNKPLHKITARTAKKELTEYGASDKIAVQLAVLNHPDISFKAAADTNDIILDEHSADAIAIAYAFMKHTLNFNL